MLTGQALLVGAKQREYTGRDGEARSFRTVALVLDGEPHNFGATDDAFADAQVVLDRDGVCAVICEFEVSEYQNRIGVRLAGLTV